uniref:Uncharacterized protein n=1 Tax=Photinus pyralis TaxID=7054 RepID=A0A1Y1JUN4_PHOPY
MIILKKTPRSAINIIGRLPNWPMITTSPNPVKMRRRAIQENTMYGSNCVPSSSKKIIEFLASMLIPANCWANPRSVKIRNGLYTVGSIKLRIIIFLCTLPLASDFKVSNSFSTMSVSFRLNQRKDFLASASRFFETSHEGLCGKENTNSVAIVPDPHVIHAAARHEVKYPMMYVTSDPSSWKTIDNASKGARSVGVETSATYTSDAQETQPMAIPVTVRPKISTDPLLPKAIVTHPIAWKIRLDFNMGSLPNLSVKIPPSTDWHSATRQTQLIIHISSFFVTSNASAPFRS